jgi:hypothetical protein
MPSALPSFVLEDIWNTLCSLNVQPTMDKRLFMNGNESWFYTHGIMLPNMTFAAAPPCIFYVINRDASEEKYNQVSQALQKLSDKYAPFSSFW